MSNQPDPDTAVRARLAEHGFSDTYAEHLLAEFGVDGTNHLLDILEASQREQAAEERRGEHAQKSAFEPPEPRGLLRYAR